MKTVGHSIATLLIGACGALGATTSFGAELGAPLPALAVKDSSGAALMLGKDIRRIYANGDRKGDKMIKAAMTGRDQAALDAQRAIVVADISAAPGFIRRIIRKDLKERSYATWMDETGQTRDVLPYREDHITVLDLDAGRVTDIRYIADAEALRQMLAAPLPGRAAPAAQVAPGTAPSSAD
jgi:hypothetical protein